MDPPSKADYKAATQPFVKQKNIKNVKLEHIAQVMS